LLIQNTNKNNQPLKDKEKWVFGGDKNMKLDKVLFSELMQVYKKENSPNLQAKSPTPLSLIP